MDSWNHLFPQPMDVTGAAHDTSTGDEDVEIAGPTVSCGNVSDTRPGAPGTSLTSLAPSSMTVRSKPQPTRSKLLDLPQELLDSITNYLSPANIVVLALVNKELLGRFIQSAAAPPPGESPQTSDPDASSSSGLSGQPTNVLTPLASKALGDYVKKVDTPKHRVRSALLSLLDNDLLDLVYCYKCKRLHGPFIPFKDRVFAPKKAVRCVDHPPDHHIPSRANRKLLRIITKRRKQGVEYSHLMAQVNNTATVYKNGILVQTSLRMRYRGDNLLLRRQRVVSSVDKTPLSLWRFFQQLSDLPISSATSDPKVLTICPHQTWRSRYGKLFGQLLTHVCKKAHRGDVSGVPAAGACSADCFSHEPYDVSTNTGNAVFDRLSQLDDTGRPRPDLLTSAPNTSLDTFGTGGGCAACTTDFHLDVVKLPEPFKWGFVLTTWLDLGPVDFCPKWDSHRDLRPPRPYVRVNDELGAACRQFENVAGLDDYVPVINELNLDRMKNYGWAERAAQGRDRYIAWNSGHCANPITGWFADPDPLDEDDLKT
ncbi:hypothetical protein PG997_012170 [Apiospora hydei]|uniref:F-box domain-containing protein n=1 Tax=Apiospora hydei TaxID=1337664 RepID=A0ABR1V2M4_9PEZI